MSKKLSKGVSSSAHLTNNSVSTTTSSSTSASAPPPESGVALNSSPTIPQSSSSLSTAAAPSILTDGLPLPRLIVFDLDYTLWPFWVDTHVVPPLKSTHDRGAPLHHAIATDKIGETFTFYQDIPQILYALHSRGVKQAVASRTEAPDLARDMLKILHVAPWTPASGGPVSGLSAYASAHGYGHGTGPTILPSGKSEKARKALDFFDGGLEIYPSSKIRHFEAIQRRTGVAYGDMLFFDDEGRNREVEQVLGVPFCLVRDGLTWGELEKGVKEWRRRRWIGVRDLDE